MKIIKKIILLLIILVIGMGIAACKDEKTERSSFTNDVKQFAAIPALPKNTMCGFAVQDGRVSCRSVITKNTAAT